MSYNYEQSIWGKGTASERWSDPTAFRLQQALRVIDVSARAAVSSENLRILEVGCGAGQFMRAIQKLRTHTMCFGCDISESALALARGANDGVTYAINDNRLPYDDSFFDVVCIFDVLEHVEHPAKVLAEVRRVLKPGGLLYAFVPCEGDSTSLWHLLEKLRLKNDLTKKYAGHINYFSRTQLCTLIESEQLHVVRKRYSEHVLGQILGVAVFCLMDRAAQRQGVNQINNETYFQTVKENGLLKRIKNAVNACVYIESALLSYIASPNMHLVAKKI